jgi:hypothetical protein
MNILIDFRTIAAIVFLVLGVICIVYYFIYEKVRQWRKRRARTLLHNEIDGYKSQIKRLERYQQIIDDMRRREAILCPTLLKGIVDMLPDPNRIHDRGMGTILQGHAVKLFISGRGTVEFNLKFVVDKEDVPTDEKGLTVRIEPLGQEVRFTLKLQNRRQYIQGVEVEVQSYYWDLRFSGIQLISDEGFGRIIDFVLSSRVVGQELGIPGAVSRILGGF